MSETLTLPSWSRKVGNPSLVSPMNGMENSARAGYPWRAYPIPLTNETIWLRAFKSVISLCTNE